MRAFFGWIFFQPVGDLGPLFVPMQFPSVAAEVSLPPFSLLTIRLRSPASDSARHVYLPARGESLRGRIRQPAWWAIFLPEHPSGLASEFLFPAFVPSSRHLSLGTRIRGNQSVKSRKWTKSSARDKRVYPDYNSERSTNLP